MILFTFWVLKVKNKCWEVLNWPLRVKWQKIQIFKDSKELAKYLSLRNSGNTFGHGCPEINELIMALSTLDSWMNEIQIYHRHTNLPSSYKFTFAIQIYLREIYSFTFSSTCKQTKRRRTAHVPRGSVLKGQPVDHNGAVCSCARFLNTYTKSAYGWRLSP